MKKFIVGLVVVAVLIAAAGSGSKEPGTAPTAAAKSVPSANVHDRKSAPEPKSKPEPEMTSAQENAIESAQSYLDISGFSKTGLIGQLSSDAGEGYSKADATFAVNHLDVDWKAEAVESAQSYLDTSSFSKSGLIEQLSSPAGEGFTLAQAQYAADKVY